ncbi:MAG: hypothetical protein FJW39_20070 [Acidobacteria bacterium]|nr:hypothetical protein [Acidobacteriota bacterium]
MRLPLIPLLCAAAFAADSTHPTGPRMTPSTLATVAPLGVQRGTTVEITVEGLNLARTSAIHFSEPGITGRIVRVKELPDLPDIRLGSNGTRSTIDLGPLPPRNQVTVELEVSPEANIGAVKFRLVTPLGSSPEGTLLVEPYFGESPDREPNDTLDGAFESYLPSVLAGAISRPGDVDHFKIQVKAGEELVFENQGGRIGSTLQPVVRIVAPDQRVLREFGYDREDGAARFTHKFDKAGTYYIRVSDYESSGRGSNFYRILAGRLPVAVSAFPLGLRRGSAAEIELAGSNLGASKVRVEGKVSPGAEDAVVLRPETPDGPAFNEVRLALGDDPEAAAAAANFTLATAQPVSLPVMINGRAVSGKDQFFKFSAKKDQKVAVEVTARRAGSELDSVVEVVDAQGRPIERAVARAVWETNTVLRDHDSAQRGLRIQAWNVLNVGDYVMVGSEVLRVEEVPDGPDEDLIVESFGGQRRGQFATTPEAHGIDRPVYKVQLYPAGAKFSPNGLPLARISYRNDDGGPGYGKDSFLDFTAPADGDYYVRIRDVRGMGGKEFGYRLNIREPRPDFRLSVNPRNPNVPRGGAIPLTVTAMRLEGYGGPIEVALSGLPAGLKAAGNKIAAGLDSCTIVVWAEDSAQAPATPFEVTGVARINGREVRRVANPEDKTQLIALAPKPDVVMAAVTKVVELAPGETKEVTVKIQRQNGFGGRVPVEVRDLPVRVRVTDSGLNGVLLNEDETVRSFKLWALPNAKATEGYVYLSGRVETRSPQQNSYASVEPVLVRVRPRE